MNRKLLNGLLVLAVATSGVGTFTSCKDENFSNELQVQDDVLQAQIDALRDLKDEDFLKNLDAWFEIQAQPIWDELEALGIDVAQLQKDVLQLQGDVTELQGDVATMKGQITDLQDYDKYLKGLIDELEKRIKALEDREDQIGSSEKYDDTELRNLITGLTNRLNALEPKVTALEKIWENIQEGNYEEVKDYVDGLYKMMLENIFPDEAWFQQIFKNEAWIQNILMRPTSVEINQVYNPVLGSINLPVGINSTLLATYKYESEHWTTEGQTMFPANLLENTDAFAEFSPYTPDAVFLTKLAALSASSSVELPVAGKVAFTDPRGVYGNMGGTVLSLNPTTVDLLNGNYTVELVNSKGVAAATSKDGGLCLDEFDGELKWGYTRGEETNIYALSVNANEANYNDLTLELNRSQLKEDLKAAVKDKSIQDIAKVGAAVAKNLNNQLDAYAVRVSWEETDPDTEEVTENAILSSFDLAATVVHPLTYGISDLTEYIPDVANRIPVFNNPLTYYLSKINNKLSLDFSDIEGVDEDKINFDLNVMVKDGKVYAYDEDGNVIGTFDYNADGISASDRDLTEFVNAILDAVDVELTDQVRKQVVDQINSAIDDINKQLADLEGKLDDFKKRLEDILTEERLDFAQNLLDKYNSLAEKAKNFLTNPNHYLQVMMAYKTNSGSWEHMSTDQYYPITVVSDNGYGMELILSSYTGDVAVPSYKKYVAVTGVWDGTTWNTDNLASYNKDGLNQVYPGHQEKFVVNMEACKGKTVRLSYLSVDYHGVVSMENCYVRVK